MAQVVEGLPSKHKALSSNPSTAKQQKILSIDVHMEEFCYFCKTELYFTVQDKTVFKEILV
jgi:hypothetical protein